MDILTPASIWASADPVEVMPLPQRIAMLVTVIGPPTGFGIGGAILWGRGTIGWPEIMTMVVMYSATGFGVTIGFHRLLTHRSFETFRPLRMLLAILGSAAAQGMAIKWCAIHRRHHQESDREGDPHSPHLHGQTGFRGLVRGLWYAHIGWAFEADKPQLQGSVRDLLADRAMVLVDRLYLLWVAMGLIVPAAALGLYYQSWNGALAGVVWGGLLRIFVMHHATWSINSVCHVFGSRPFDSADHSTNNFPIAIVSLGEGWHNNHHAFPNSARHGLRWWQLDSSYIIIKTMSLLGLVWNVRVPSDEAMRAKARRAAVFK